MCLTPLRITHACGGDTIRNCSSARSERYSRIPVTRKIGSSAMPTTIASKRSPSRYARIGKDVRGLRRRSGSALRSWTQSVAGASISAILSSTRCRRELMSSAIDSSSGLPTMESSERVSTTETIV